MKAWEYRTVLIGLTLLMAAPRAGAEDVIPAVGWNRSELGMLARRPFYDKPESIVLPWKLVKPRGKLVANELLLGLPGAEISSPAGDVRIHMVGNLDNDLPYPVIETAVALHNDPKLDFDVTLDRGRIDIVNQKDNGSAQVRVRFRDQNWLITLDGKNSEVCLVLSGRWECGQRFCKVAKKGERKPTGDLLLVVEKGTATLQVKDAEYTLTAPPGPAYFHWDSVAGHDARPRKLDKLPDWAHEGTRTIRGKIARNILEEYRILRVNKGLIPAAKEFMESKNPLKRTAAVYTLAAMDDLPTMGQLIKQSKYQDIWDDVVVAMRHWLGRHPGMDVILYEGLIKTKQLNEVQAETFISLLHDFDETELARPETYETLIDYLVHEEYGIRGLAHWHLIRLVPGADKIPYNPAGSEKERQKAMEAFFQLVPPGKLPKGKS